MNVLSPTKLYQVTLNHNGRQIPLFTPRSRVEIAAMARKGWVVGHVSQTMPPPATTMTVAR